MIVLGEESSGRKLKLDLDRLIETRLLIQANSGGGKSYLIRKLLESTHGKVQQIVLDMEGEFSTLREKYDYILAGKGGDIPAEARSAELLARKVLELNTSIIIDLYELKVFDRHRFVKNFLEALVNAPKELWHQVLVVIDEAHVFAPEKGKSEAMGAVVDIATRGRKRGFCAVLATQRLSKLHKDVAAECNNKLIGRTGLDIDMKRASEELGFTTKSQMLSLRSLLPGEFFAFGPALTTEVQKVNIDPVETKHPKAGQRLKSHVPVPTKKVKAILEKLTDLPKEAEQELHDKQQMLTRIRELEREQRLVKKEVDPKALEAAYERGLKEGEKWKKRYYAIREDVLKKANNLMAPLKVLIESAVKEIKEIPALKERDLDPFRYATGNIKTPMGTVHVKSSIDESGREYGKCEKAILQFLSMREGNSFNKSQIGALTGYSPTSGSFNNALSSLYAAGLVLKSGARIQINTDQIPKVQEILGPLYNSGDPHSLEEWLNKLGKCEQLIYQKLLECPDVDWEKDKLGEETGYSPTSGSFNNSISRLVTLGLAKRVGSGCIQLNNEIVGI